MNALVAPLAGWFRRTAQAWDEFWFRPELPHTLAAIRILGGAMLLYTHAVWTINLEAFLGQSSWLNTETAVLLNRRQAESGFAWSYLYWVQSPGALWALHVGALIVFAMLTVGLFTRVVAVLAWIAAVSYCHRLNGTLFGLDQINVFVATYLMVGDSGGVWSMDRWRKSVRGYEPGSAMPMISTNVAVRLLQLHMCVIYLFGGIGKARGGTWWDGSAMWLAFASLEYQSLDMTWTVHYPWLLAILAHVTVFWEMFYCVLVWPKLTRSLCLAMAVMVHLGIAVCLGMKTFGLAMLIGNLAFVYPETVRGLVAALGRFLGQRRGAFQNHEAQPVRAVSLRPGTSPS